MADTETTGKKATLARTVKDKWRAKRWFKIRAPGLFQHAELGETPANEPEEVIGRTLESTLPEMTGGGDATRAHIKLRFQIERVSGEGVAETKFVGHELTTDYVRRLARRKRSKIDLSIPVTTQDGVRMVVKPVAVGEQRLQSRLRAELRHRLADVLVEEARTKPAATFIRDMLGGELTKALAQGVKPLYPLKKIEIRESMVEGTLVDDAGPSGAPPLPTESSEESPAAPAPPAPVA